MEEKEIEILKDYIYDFIWDEYYKEMKKTKRYKVYYNIETKEIHIDAPLKVKHLYKIKRMLKDRGILYSNLIIGNPEI